MENSNQARPRAIIPGIRRYLGVSGEMRKLDTRHGQSGHARVRESRGGSAYLFGVFGGRGWEPQDEVAVVAGLLVCVRCDVYD